MDWQQFSGDPADVYAAIHELLERPAWHADALCREHPELTWFPEVGEHPQRAREVCARCLVRAECLAAGMREVGMWGGTSARERRRLRVERGDIVVGRHRAVA